jgi:hypothetical protein
MQRNIKIGAQLIPFPPEGKPTRLVKEMTIKMEKEHFAAYLVDPDGEVDTNFSVGNNLYKMIVSMAFMIPMLRTPPQNWWLDPVRGDLNS